MCGLLLRVHTYGSGIPRLQTLSMHHRAFMIVVLCAFSLWCPPLHAAVSLACTNMYFFASHSTIFLPFPTAFFSFWHTFFSFRYTFYRLLLNRHLLLGSASFLHARLYVSSCVSEYRFVCFQIVVFTTGRNNVVDRSMYSVSTRDLLIAPYFVSFQRTFSKQYTFYSFQHTLYILLLNLHPLLWHACLLCTSLYIAVRFQVSFCAFR